MAYKFWSPESPRPQPISRRLLLAVNIPLGCALTVLLVLEYRREMAQALAEQQISLKEEAIVIHQAVRYLIETETTARIEDFVDQMRLRMNAVDSRNHRLVVTWTSRMNSAQELSAGATQIAVPLVAAFRSGERQFLLDGNLLVFDGVDDGEICSIVSEDAQQIQDEVRRQLVLQLGSLAGLAIFAAAIVTVAVYQLVGRPLRKMAHTVDVIARGEFGAQVASSPSLELQGLAESVNSMSHALALVEDKRRREMDLARKIQEYLLPNGISVPGLHVASLYLPADDVAGDYFDLLAMPDGCWLIAVADVTGHGVPSAMAAAMLKALLLVVSESAALPHEIIGQVNRRFVAILRPGLFVTAFVARWCPKTHRLTYANAGHPPGLIYRPATGIEELASSGMPVGLMEQTTCTTRETALSPDDRLVLYTDGVTEAWSPEGELFGEQRLKNVILREHAADPDGLLAAIASEVKSHCAGRELVDDLTLLVIAPLQLAISD